MVRGAAAAIDFYRDAFDAVETQRLVGDDGRIGHAEVTIGGARVDATFERAVALGAVGVRPPADQFHGSRGFDLLVPETEA